VIRAIVIALLLVSAALLQTALFQHLAIAGFRPDLLLLVTAAFALRDGPLTGTGVGFVAGLLSDLLLVDAPIGPYTAVLLVIGYGVGRLRPYIPGGSITAPIAVAFATGVLGTAGYALLSRLLGDPRFTLDLITAAALLIGLYNTLLAPPVFALTEVLSRRFPPQRAAPT
jgi:rod shape-determining protein MreD